MEHWHIQYGIPYFRMLMDLPLVTKSKMKR